MSNTHNVHQRGGTVSVADQLCDRIATKQAKVGVVGLGYVGLPLALAFAEKGFSTTGFDVDAAKVASLNDGVSYIGHIAGDAIAREIQEKRFHPTNEFADLREMDAIVICVPTPLT